MKTIPSLISASLVGASLLFTSCSSKPDPVVINLDTVLDEFKATADSMPADKFKAAAPVISAETSNTTTAIPTLPADDKITEFTAKFQKGLNEKKVLPNGHIAVRSNSDGSFLGYKDDNKNSHKDPKEQDLFKIEVDDARGRLIASDLTHTQYRRESSYTMGGGGFFTGYLIGSMLSRQSYSGVDTRRFRSMRSSPRGYHSNAVKSVKSRASGGTTNSARSSSGSRSFRSGK